MEPEASDADPSPFAAVTQEGIAVIPIVGTLVSRSGFVDAASGLLAYAEIGAALTTVYESDFDGIALDAVRLRRLLAVLVRESGFCAWPVARASWRPSPGG